VRLVLASRNRHKLAEFRSLLAAHDLVELPEGVRLPPESGESFAANALPKAQAAAAATGLPAIADDSGIEAAALGGAPGVRSARFAGEGATDQANLDKLLREVAARDGDRRVTYVCALAYVDESDEQLFESRCHGELTLEPRGAGGFGYDPAFVPVDVPGGRTMAELAPEEKAAVSHRGRAARELLGWLER
jgi:XTP/dITP diphosphohydrolase